MHSGEPDAVLVVEPAAHVDGGGVCPFGRADPLAFEIRGRPDLAVLVDVEGREAEVARAHDRQRDDVGLLARHLGRELRKRQFADIPFPIEVEGRYDLVQLGHQPGVLDAFRLHRAGAEIAEVVVVLGGDREVQLLHRGRSVRSLASIASLALATMSSGVATRSVTIDWIVAPSVGETSRPALRESSTYAGSRIIASKAARSSATRSAGTPGEVTNGRPITTSVENSRRMRRSSSLFAKSVSRGTCGNSASRMSPTCAIRLILPVRSHSPFSALRLLKLLPARPSISPRSIARPTSAVL